MEDRIVNRVYAKLKGQPPLEQDLRKDDSFKKLLSHYHDKQKKGKSTFPESKNKKLNEPSTDEVFVDVCTMVRSRKGGWISCGNNVKVLSTYSDDYDTMVHRLTAALNFSEEDPLLVCGGSVIQRDVFRDLGHFFGAAHIRPGKALFGIASNSEESFNPESSSCSSTIGSSQNMMVKSALQKRRNIDEQESFDAVSTFSSATGPSHKMMVSSSPRKRRNVDEKFSQADTPSSTCGHKCKISKIVISDDESDMTVSRSTFGQKLRSTGLHVYSDERIIELTSRFKRMQFVKEGGFGEVFVGNVGNQQVAFKKLKEGVTTDSLRDGLHQLLNEATLLTRYRHRNLVPIVAVCPGPKFPAVLYEYMEKGSLYDHLHCHCDILNFTENVRILMESSEGLAYLHGGHEAGRQAVTHCDVKSANILLDKNLTAKVGDFGLARTMPVITDGRSYITVASCGGSHGYQAPELLEGEIGPKLDVYGLAVVFLEVWTRCKAYDKDRQSRKLVDHMQDALLSNEEFKRARYSQYGKIAVDDDTSSSMRSIIVDMLKTRHLRLTMGEVYKHIRAMYCNMLMEQDT